MSENEYTQYSYNPYQQSQDPSAQQPAAPIAPEAPQRPVRRGFFDYVFGQNLAAKLQGNPLLATISLLAVGAAFAGIVAITHPENATTPEDIPVVEAETTAFKAEPAEAGGATIPNEDSTIFAVMREDAFEPAPGKPVRNLLEPQEPVEIAVEDKLASFAEEAETLLLDTESKKAPAFSEAVTLSKTEPAAGDPTAAEKPQKISKTVPLEHKKIRAEDLIRKAESKRPDSLHAAGASPETLAFVRSVLDKKDTKTTEAETAKAAKVVSKVQPASGGQTSTVSAASGSYYVQLGSVTSAVGAEKEWLKLQKTFGLENSGHRVQEANLGARGIYYRIQAGPFEQNQANSICNDIKAQKPGGCLVVK